MELWISSTEGLMMSDNMLYLLSAIVQATAIAYALMLAIYANVRNQYHLSMKWKHDLGRLHEKDLDELSKKETPHETQAVYLRILTITSTITIIWGIWLLMFAHLGTTGDLVRQFEAVIILYVFWSSVNFGGLARVALFPIEGSIQTLKDKRREEKRENEDSSEKKGSVVDNIAEQGVSGSEE